MNSEKDDTYVYLRDVHQKELRKGRFWRRAEKTAPALEAEQEDIKKLFKDDENSVLAYCSAMTEAKGYCQKTRLEEIMDFARRCGFTKLGLAFLRRNAAGSGGNNPYSDAERVSGGLRRLQKRRPYRRNFLGIRDEDKVRPGAFEPMCRPHRAGRLPQ